MAGELKKWIVFFRLAATVLSMTECALVLGYECALQKHAEMHVVHLPSSYICWQERLPQTLVHQFCMQVRVHGNDIESDIDRIGGRSQQQRRHPYRTQRSILCSRRQPLLAETQLRGSDQHQGHPPGRGILPLQRLCSGTFPSQQRSWPCGPTLSAASTSTTLLSSARWRTRKQPRSA